jgi:hypothetical protein
VFLYGFDLIELDGEDMRREPFETRKATLASLLKRAAPGLRLNEHIEADGPTVFAHACKMGLEREYVEAGGLMSYGPNLPDLLRRAAEYVDKVLRGTKPGDIPVEQPTRFDLIINLTTAKALSLTVPPSLLARADEVIE